MISALKRAVRKSSYIIREEGAATWLTRTARIGIVRARRLVQNKTENIDRWAGLKGKYAGKRVFLVGNGPSLNATPMHLLRNEHVMCFNRFYLMFERLGWRPDLYAMSDDRVAFDIADEVASEVLPIVDAAFFPDIHPYNVDFRKVIPPEKNVFWLYLDRLDFSDDLPFAGMNKTVANVGLQVLAYLGFGPIYLLGVDMSYSRPESVVEDNSRDWTSTGNDDPNHFDPRYFGNGSRYHAPRMDETRERYVRAKSFFDEREVAIHNAGVGGELDVFPRVSFRSLFPNVDAQQELEWILEAVDASDATVPSGSITADARVTPAFDPALDWSWIPAANAEGLTDVLRTHLVFGPTESEQYLVVARGAGPAW